MAEPVVVALVAWFVWLPVETLVETPVKVSKHRNTYCCCIK